MPTSVLTARPCVHRPPGACAVSNSSGLRSRLVDGRRDWSTNSQQLHRQRQLEEGQGDREEQEEEGGGGGGLAARCWSWEASGATWLTFKARGGWPVLPVLPVSCTVLYSTVGQWPVLYCRPVACTLCPVAVLFPAPVVTGPVTWLCPTTGQLAPDGNCQHCQMGN